MIDIPTLDVSQLRPEQVAAAREAFDTLKDRCFLQFDKIDKDPARAELDRRLLVDVLELPESLYDEGEPVDPLRSKPIREPKIRGGKTLSRRVPRAGRRREYAAGAQEMVDTRAVGMTDATI